MSDPSAAVPTTAPYGSWESPITAELIACGTIRLGQIAIGGPDGRDIYWSEGRPQEQGRSVVVRHRPDGRQQDLNPAPFNARTLVHEYGGGAYALVDGETLCFCHYDDQRLYLSGPDGQPHALTHGTDLRYADAVHDRMRGRLIAVREDHRQPGREAINTLVAVDLATGDERVLAEGHDFYSNPQPSPDGKRLAWLSWDHPAMPWDGTTLWLADVQADGTLAAPTAVAGGTEESIFQPLWSPSGDLHFVSDRSGWWNLYRLRGGTVEAVHPMAAEFGTPQWIFGMSRYGFDAQGRIVCAPEADGDSFLLVIDGNDATRMATPYRSIGELRVGADFIVFNGASATEAEAIVRLDLATGAHDVLRRSSRHAVDPACVSAAEAIAFRGAGGLESHAFYYAPRNPRFQGATGARPPLLVIGHGGPTSATSAGLKWGIQFWTSRGFAVVDVNYGGSHGYGRAYRQRLDGRWGEVDVDDSIAAARHLVERGAVDPAQVAIRGASAGGYTTLAALTFRDFFKAGASHYGIGDLEALAHDTHKFESRYLDRLIGPYPERRDLYVARSPVHHAERLSSAMILFQGAEDKAVPPGQAEAMYAAVRAKSLPVAYLLFAGEQHGFRRAETIRRVFEAELYFYGRVFAFRPAGDIEPVPIDNLS
ncbi:MAG: S9 family peptidase [Proteobacteria bacterium]|nr:S9 family peptidase [Pseudomonadota bacterium]